jgi:Fe-S-cluster containining protein
LVSKIRQARRHWVNIVNLPWWSDGLYFSCTGCGVCCGREPGAVSFTAEERSVMSGSLGITEEEFTARYTWKKYGAISLREKKNYDCVFLQINNPGYRCKIYSVRPAQCGAFPFWAEVLESRGSWEKYSSSCPGMNAGEFHSYEEISKIAVEYIVNSVANFL